MHNATPPARLLLATDLSPCCDRALERAARLAADWRAELIALHVLDAAASPDGVVAWSDDNEDGLLQIARRQLTRDLQNLPVQPLPRILRAHHAAEGIRDVAVAGNCGLVVTGVARQETLDRWLLGSSVEALAYSLPRPLLVVRQRAHGPYRRIAVATDFGAPSRQALKTAARWFADGDLRLYHAYQTPLGGLADQPPSQRLRREIEHGDCAAFLKRCALPQEIAVTPVIEAGVLEARLTEYVRDQEIDLVVVGTYGERGVMNRLFGGAARRLLEWLPCDVLVVPENSIEAESA